MRGQPAFGGGDLAILFGVPVLRRDELGPQRHHLRVAGADDDRRDRAVKMRDLAVGVRDAGTVGAVDIFGGGGKVPRRIQRDEPGVLHRAHGRQHTQFIKGPVEIIEQFHQMLRRDRVERLADVIVGGDACDSEEGAGVIAAAGLFHVPLETQERGTLGEEDREGGQGDVGHGELSVVPRARVRQRAGHGAQAGDEVIETQGLLHALLDAGTGSKVQVTIV